MFAGCTETSLSGPDRAPIKCQVTLASAQTAIAAGGGNGTVNVEAAPECAWTASSEQAWVSDLNPSSGQGRGTIQFKAAPNTSQTVRAGDLAVNDARVRITQDAAPCRFDVAPSSVPVSAAGGSASVAVTTTAACAWTAVSQASWIAVTSPRENSGNGTVTFTAAANTDPSGSRTGTIVIASQTITVSQPARNCDFALTPPSQTVPAGGGSATINVSTASQCSWTATTDVPWITITGNPQDSGSGTVTFAAQANSGAARTGHITIGGDVVTVSQEGATGTAPPQTCTYSISPGSQSFGDAGGSGTTSVTTHPDCGWTVTSNTSWIGVTTGSSATGPGNVSFTVSQNTGSARNGTLSIAGQTFTVNQSAAAPTCNYTLTPSSQSVGSSSGNGTNISVNASSSLCSWTASSADSWITVAAPGNGTGNGTVSWSYGANTGPERTGTIAVPGKTFAVTQASGCSFSINPPQRSIDKKSGSFSVSVTASSSSCTWNASTPASWITITTGASGTGSGVVNYSAQENETKDERTGIITIAGQPHRVEQAK